MLTQEFSQKMNNLFSDALSLSAPLEPTRHSARRVGPHKEAEFSSQSIMKAMETFVEAVQDMEQTILVPSRLMDMKVGDDSDTVETIGPKDTSADLYRIYSMVNCVKNELLWGNNPPCEEELSHSTGMTPSSSSMTLSQEATTLPSSSTPCSSLGLKGHARRPSTASLASTQSTAMSDTDSETSNENDSGIEGETEARPDFVSTTEASFRRHLHGLQRSLAQMTNAANYLTKRYQKDIGAST